MRQSRTWKLVSDRDPIVYQLRTLINDEGLTKRPKDVAILSNRHISTIKNLLDGTTYRPLNSTAQAIISGLGYEMVITKKREFNLEEEIVICRTWNEKENERAAKKREKA
jgi:hypothetical protein